MSWWTCWGQRLEKCRENKSGVTIRIVSNDLVEVTSRMSICNEFGWRVDVPRGFVTDGASIPRLLWPLIGHPLSGEFLQAAIVHDLLCHHAFLLKSYEHRVMADAFFFWLLAQLHVPYWKQALMYVAVRLWGRWTYEPRSLEHFLEVTLMKDYADELSVADLMADSDVSGLDDSCWAAGTASADSDASTTL